MKKIFFTLALFITSFCFAQLENANWCFTINARVDFNTTPPTPSACATNNTTLTFAANSVSVSNNNGQLLFYSNGILVWDKSHNIMPHGANIGGGVDGVFGQQTTVIVPKPNSPNLYYIFTANKITTLGSPLNPGHNGGLHYVIVDMSANGGMGDVVTDAGGTIIKTTLKNQAGSLMDYDYISSTGLQIFESRISSTPNKDGTKIWLSFFTRFYVGATLQRWALQYLISDNGIGINNDVDGIPPTPNTSYLLDDSNFPIVPNWYFIGTMKFSPDGKYLCDANTSSVMLYRFDNEFGNILSFPIPRKVYSYTSPASVPGLGLEFSPGSNYLYFSTYDDKIYQDGLTQSSKPITKKYIRIRQIGFLTPDTVRIVGEFEDITKDTTHSLNHITTPIFANGFNGELQLAINGKIYICAVYTANPQFGKLAVIGDPNQLNCQYSPNGITLQPLTSHFGSLPQWVHKALPPPSTGPWVWMHGDNIGNQVGVYGTQNVPSPNNKPGSRQGAMNWKDLNDNLWLFGGLHYASYPYYEDYNDLWKYNISTNQWTWVKGDNVYSQLPVYGTQGVPSLLNKPGARVNGVTWTDLSGSLWLYGGSGKDNSSSYVGTLGDLWKCDISADPPIWTWKKGDNTINQFPIYGTQGLPSPLNTPGSRHLSVSWLDLDGHLWLFGGSSSSQLLNDLWKCDISVDPPVWTWVRGDNVNYFSNYGVKGVEAASNQPGYRVLSISWTDNQGYLWIYGGKGSDATGQTFDELNDLWRFNINTGNWTWMGGDNLQLQPGVYGTKGTASALNKPGARHSSFSFKGLDGNLWLFGGYGRNDQPGLGQLNDLWKCDISLNPPVWTWVSGDKSLNNLGNYGTIGSGNQFTLPPGKYSGSSWVSNNGNFWLFGGACANTPYVSNDLWKYTGNCTGPNCLIGKYSSSSKFVKSSLQSNPIANQVKVSSVASVSNKTTGIAKPLVSNIQSLEIYNTAGQLLKKVNSELECYEILRNSKATSLIPGLYFVKVLYKDKTSKTIKQFLQ